MSWILRGVSGGTASLSSFVNGRVDVMTHRMALLAAALVVCTGMVSGQKVGTTSLQFLKVMPTARATAMGDAFSSLASGADAVFWNPAGMMKSGQVEVVSTLTLWLFD